MSELKDVNDFSKGRVWKNILRLAIPITLAQLVQMFYSIVDRIYIGHLPYDAANAITGLGLTFPIIMLISAFTQFAASGGAPLCSIARGQGNKEYAEKLMGNSFSLLLIFGISLMCFFYIFLKKTLYAFGASDVTYPYAFSYMQIYLLGTIFVMIGTGMNPFINLQGFGKTGMLTTIIGAVSNIILDPLLIFVFKLGIRGAAIATIISQFLSAVWVLKFLTGNRAVLVIRRKNMIIDDFSLILKILGLGMSGFIMAVTNSLTQITFNYTLKKYGGDIYVGVMAILNSVREMFTMIVQGIHGGAQPVIGFNYGAGKLKRVKQGIVFSGAAGMVYTVAVWLLVNTFPHAFISIFTSDPQIIDCGISAIKIYFGGFFMMSLQFCGQSTFVALGKSKNAVFFSLLRKAFIVVPLALILPKFLGVDGVFYSEPISNYIGGLACFITMLFVVRKIMTQNTAALEK